MENKFTYRMITNEMNEFVGQAKVDKNNKVVEVQMFGETYTDPKEWEEKFGLSEFID